MMELKERIFTFVTMDMSEHMIYMALPLFMLQFFVQVSYLINALNCPSLIKYGEYYFQTRTNKTFGCICNSRRLSISFLQFITPIASKHKELGFR